LQPGHDEICTVEDEPLISLDLPREFERHGARTAETTLEKNR
jgi:hypothetical protein